MPECLPRPVNSRPRAHDAITVRAMRSAIFRIAPAARHVSAVSVSMDFQPAIFRTGRVPVSQSNPKCFIPVRSRIARRTQSTDREEEIGRVIMVNIGVP